MGKTVILAEKPSVAKSIAKITGCSQKAEGYLYNDKYIVTWALGHLVTLKEPNEIDEKYKKWDIIDLPIKMAEIPLKIIPASKAQYTVVKNLFTASSTDSIVCATDAGREGELIFRYIYIMTKCKKPFQRLWINSLTDEAIRSGLDNLRPGNEYDALFRSAKCRSEADWLVGMNASRAYSLSYDALLSVGRVQTPTLAFLVKRQQEIENFKPEKYFTVTARFTDYDGTFFSDRLQPDTHIRSEQLAQEVTNYIKGRKAHVISAETQNKKDLPPQLYDLTTLQRDANKYFGFTAEKSLKLAQSLYERHKALTYPRTDSRYLPPDMIPIVRETMEKMPEQYENFTRHALSIDNTAAFSSKRVVDASKVSDHHALLPTNVRPDMDALSDEERKLFDLVVRRMYVAFYPPHEYEATKVVTSVDNKYTFRTTGKKVTINGWREVPPTEHREAEMTGEQGSEESPVLPDIQLGDERIVTDSSVKEDYTKPPSSYTDASLLLAMETAGKDAEDDEVMQQMKGHGIGTPATRAEIIERLIKVGYAERNKKTIVPTRKGIALINIMPQEITSAETTGRWELALNKIAENRQDPKAFMESIDRFVAFLVDNAQKRNRQIDSSAFSDGKTRKYDTPKSTKLDNCMCPICNKGTIREMPDGENGSGSFFCSDWQNCHFRIWKNCFEKSGGPRITKDILVDLIENNSYTYDEGRLILQNDAIEFYRDGSEIPEASTQMTYERKEKKGNNHKSPATKKALEGLRCPVCGKGFVSESEKAFGCTDWKNGCKFTIWKNCLSRAEGPLITSGIIKTLIGKKKPFVASGTSVIINGNKLLYFKAGKDTKGQADYVVKIC